MRRTAAPGTGRLRLQYAEARRSSHHYGPSCQKRRERDGGAEGGVCRRPRNSQHGIATGFFQMKTRIVTSFAVVSALGLTSFILHAHPRQQSATPATQGADFTGVWYPSTGSTLGAATADNPGQWAYHCHLLYHMEAGMFREVVVA